MSVMSEISLPMNETDREMSLFDNTGETNPTPQKAETVTASPATVDVATTTAQPTSVPEQTEDEKRRAHEEAEAKQKAEWEAKKKARDEEILIAWEEALDVTPEQLTEKSLKRIGDMTERLTRRNMKECVKEHLQMLCYENENLSRNALHPKKSMINCFKYINRKALEYLKQFQEESGEKPIDNVISGDVPDDLCYQWAEEYFMDLNAEEDKTEEDKEFVPTQYHSTITLSTKKKGSKKKSAPKKAESAKKDDDNQMQITLESLQQVSLQEGAA